MKTKIGMLILLLPCTAADLKYRRIPVVFVTVFTIIAVCVRMTESTLSMRQLLWFALPGIGMLLISWLTRGKIGAGDGLMVTALGIWYGRDIIVGILIPSFFMTALFGCAELLIKRAKRNDELPYAPFLFGACILEQVLGYLEKTVG